jgi:hypothetical protein
MVYQYETRALVPYTEEVVGSSPIPHAQEPPGIGVVLLVVVSLVPDSASLGVQAVPYRVIDTKRSEVNCWYTPYVHLWSSYARYITCFQTSRGKTVGKHFINHVSHSRRIAFHLQ